MTTKEQALNVLTKELHKKEYLFDYEHGYVDIDYREMIDFISNKMVEFARIKCEEQKEACTESQWIESKSEIESILNCRNVCNG